MALTKKEKKELEELDNPEIEFLQSPTGLGGVFSNLFKVSNRKERVVELKTKKRMGEAGLDENKDWQKYYEIQEEEEKRFDDKLKK